MGMETARSELCFPASRLSQGELQLCGNGVLFPHRFIGGHNLNAIKFTYPVFNSMIFNKYTELFSTCSFAVTPCSMWWSGFVILRNVHNSEIVIKLVYTYKDQIMGKKTIFIYVSV
jgi:hypothetical protein